jgi:hypothetical protein
MDTSAIADPRVFPDIAQASAEAAALYELAMRSAATTAASEADALRAELCAAMSQQLCGGDGAALATLFAGAPSVDVARALWRALDAAWRDVTSGQDGIAITLFAIPIVVIAASSETSEGTLPGVLADTTRLDALSREHGALRGNASAALANALVTPDSIDVASLPRLLTWHRIDGRDDALRTLAPAPLAYVAGRESVHARLAVGSAVAAPGVDLLDRSPAPTWAMAFTRELNSQLATRQASVLALPASPARPLQAAREAKLKQRDVAAQVFASNALRRLRGRSGEPAAVLSAHRAADAPGGGELRLSLSSPLDEQDAEGFRCALDPLERAADAARALVALLRDCRVADVQLVAGVHADLVEGSAQRLLFKASSLPASAPTMH